MRKNPVPIGKIYFRALVEPVNKLIVTTEMSVKAGNAALDYYYLQGIIDNQTIHPRPKPVKQVVCKTPIKKRLKNGPFAFKPIIFQNATFSVC